MNPAKVDPALQLQTQVSFATLQAPEVDVIIRHTGAAFFSQASGRVKDFSLINAKAMRIQVADIDALSEQDDIEYIWADLPVHTCLNTSVPLINVPAIWDKGYRGQGVKLAVIDTGIDPKHPDFTGRIAGRKNFTEGSDDDENGHGTHVASIAVGDGRASGGLYRGVAPEAELYIAKVLDANGNGQMSEVMAAIEWAVDQGVQVINLSLGGDVSCDGTDALSTLCDAAVAQAGVVLCVAAGNSGPNGQTVGSPGCAKQVITVGASTDGDAVAQFSSRGPTLDGRIKPDLLLPGVGIIAAQATGTQLGAVIQPGYISLEGTSMATPHVAGGVCLFLQARPELTPAQVKRILRNTAVDLLKPANAQGAGRVDLLRALDYPAEPLPTPPQPETPQPTPTPPSEKPKGCLAALFGG